MHLRLLSQQARFNLLNVKETSASNLLKLFAVVIFFLWGVMLVSCKDFNPFDNLANLISHLATLQSLVALAPHSSIFTDHLVLHTQASWLVFLNYPLVTNHLIQATQASQFGSFIPLHLILRPLGLANPSFLAWLL